MILDPAHLAEMQHYIAVVAITPSALRNLGGKGFVESAQEFVSKIDLEPLATMDPSAYPSWLDDKTEKLRNEFPGEKPWGPARKSVNIFMTMAALNRFLCTAYELHRFDDALEVPLDNIVAREVSDWGKDKYPQLPKWQSIKHLEREDSKKFQEIAREMAKELQIPRSRLDVVLWAKRRNE